MAKDIQPVNSPEAYLGKFSRFETASNQPKWLLPIRKAGLARFSEIGTPTLDHEDWRFTNTAAIAKLPFNPAFDSGASISADQLDGLVFAKQSGSRLVFVNGHFAPKLSSVKNLPAGAKAGSLAAALASDAAFLEKHLGKYAASADNGFSALNQAFFLDGGFVHVPAGKIVEEPIQFIYVSTAGQTGATIHPRNLVIAEANSSVTILESYVTLGGAGYFTNAVTELFVGDNARLEFVKFQDEATDAFHMASFHGEFGRASNVNVHSFALGAKLSRNNIRTKLAGEGLECVLNGLYLTRGEQLADHHMIVEHAQPHCASHEYFNGILDDKSKGVFHGRILVREIAQKTDETDEQESTALGRHDRRHETAVGDLRRRREVHARRDHRPVEQGIHLLSPDTRHRSRDGAAHVDPRLCWRDHRTYPARSSARRVGQDRVGSPRSESASGGMSQHG